MDDDYKDTYVSSQTFSLPLGEQHPICQANPKRVALMFGCQSGLTYFAPNQQTLTAVGPGAIQGGFNFFTSQLVLISRRLHGALATCAWLAQSTGSADAISVVEVFEP